MNLSDFSSSRLFARLFGQANAPATGSDPLQPGLLESMSGAEKGGVGSSWEERTINQNEVALSATFDGLATERVMESLVRSPQLVQLPDSFADTSAAATVDPIGAAANNLSNQTSQATSSVSYPGYVLQYSPGFPLEYRPAVAQWQQQMRDRGWAIDVDGFYGLQSERIARQFQAEKGLVVDGIVGAQTWQATFDNSTITGVNEPDTSVDLSPVQPISDPISDSTSITTYPGSTLSYRPFQPLSFDPQAQVFQQRLKDLGWRIEADGLFGPRSEAATRLIQQQNNLTVDGIVGPLTWAAVFNEQAPLAPTEQTLNPVASSNRINAVGLELIKSFEGLRLNSYRDAVGVWTIGYGHTRTAGPGQSISYAQSTELLKADVSTFEQAVTQAVRVPITANQFAALVSFAYNVGSGALSSSTLLRRLNAGDTYGAANEFLRWNRAGGRVLYGLTRRREAERALFLS